ncbi:MAG TPA: LLM class flavin-dependent oxidoreductase [Candidatus Binataceae bacterium]|nr:LLM class flavin-dependent oxidoreductase [Candidatus Binataceae bacterium]
MKKLMHLMGFVLNSPMNHTIGSWAHPRNNVNYHYAQPEVWQHIARTLERGRFDGVFFADQLAAYGNFRGNTDEALRHALQFPVHDPLLLIPMMAAVTDCLGFASTLSVTYYPPYMAVRKLSTLDHLTKGRIGWNIVTSLHTGEARNMGLKEMIPHDLRYERADEYMEVCYKLWDSWEPDAVVMDRDGDIFADPAKVHPINHEGKWFTCPGFSCVIPSPQGRPVLFQAGASGAGRDFCAKHAEAAFIIQYTPRAMKLVAADLKERTRKFGRKPEDLKITCGIQVIVGGTEEEARAKQQVINDRVPYEAGLALLSGHTNYDLSKFDPDKPVDEISGIQGAQGLFDALVKMHNVRLTLREIGKIYGGSVAMPQIVGTPEQVADQMEYIMKEADADGFNITPTYTPGSFDEFVDLVVPILQKRGVHRKEYTTKTLRESVLQTEL